MKHKKPVVRMAGEAELKQMSANSPDPESWGLLEGYLADPKIQLLQVIVPIPVNLFDDETFDIPGEVYEEVREAIPIAIRRYLEHVQPEQAE